MVKKKFGISCPVFVPYSSEVGQGINYGTKRLKSKGG